MIVPEKNHREKRHLLEIKTKENSMNEKEEEEEESEEVEKERYRNPQECSLVR